MRIRDAANLWLEHHETHSKENSIRSYKAVVSSLCHEFGDEEAQRITTERVLSFLTRMTEGRKPQTKRTRYSHLLGFCNFIKNNIDEEFRNPCDTRMLKKLFKVKSAFHWDLIEAATYASRSGVPIEIVRKIILRHANLSTTQRYLGKISDVEALKWIDNLYA